MTRDVAEVAAALDRKCRGFRNELTSITRTLAADLNHHFAARTTEAIVQDAVAWVIERVETRKDEAVKALREGRDPGDLDYDL